MVTQCSPDNLSLVQATGSGCLIYRETSGRYVVSHEQEPMQRQTVATLAGAYAACRGWEQRHLGGRRVADIQAAV
ncbi:MAG: hypothetical protein VKI83_00975 [Synechococcaceae cyanobacterium]|nr:hypothetical protein [Synechococcaceae cyanobacterium]